MIFLQRWHHMPHLNNKYTLNYHICEGTNLLQIKIHRFGFWGHIILTVLPSVSLLSLVPSPHLTVTSATHLRCCTLWVPSAPSAALTVTRLLHPLVSPWFMEEICTRRSSSSFNLCTCAFWVGKDQILVSQMEFCRNFSWMC